MGLLFPRCRQTDASCSEFNDGSPAMALVTIDFSIDEAIDIAKAETKLLTELEKQLGQGRPKIKVVEFDSRVLKHGIRIYLTVTRAKTALDITKLALTVQEDFILKLRRIAEQPEAKLPIPH